jgi:plastocyanin
MRIRGFLAAGALGLGLVLTGCGGGGGSGSSGPSALTLNTSAGTDLKFDPITLEAPANSKVTLTFNNKSDSLPHNLAFAAPVSAKGGDIVAPGASETLEFTTPGPGTYKYTCTIHPGMEGTLTVK